MWWLDKSAVETGMKFRDEFDVQLYVESGTYKGINLKFWSHRFDKVIGIEIDREHFWQTRRKLDGRANAEVICKDSGIYLGEFAANYFQDSKKDIVLFYLDAHFYLQKANKTKEDRWVILRELKALRGFKNCVIVIHDFNCEGLYGLVYDGEPLDFALIKDALAQINPDFSYYTNMKEYCNLHTEESIIGIEGIDPDLSTLEAIHYHAQSHRLQYRGILYCTPRPLDLKRFQLKELVQ